MFILTEIRLIKYKIQIDIDNIDIQISGQAVGRAPEKERIAVETSTNGLLDIYSRAMQLQCSNKLPQTQQSTEVQDRNQSIKGTGEQQSFYLYLKVAKLGAHLRSC